MFLKGVNAYAQHTSAAAQSQQQYAATPMPKHIPFPDVAGFSELLAELVMFLFVAGAAALQFVNIYRTAWWMPHSYTNHALNTHLIEPYLVALIVILSVRRLVYAALLRALELLRFDQAHQRWHKIILRYAYGSLLLIMLAACVTKISLRHSYFALFLLIYPLVVYLLIFGFRMEPFLRSQCEIEGAYFNGMPMHCCSSNPSNIRDEIELLKNDFNFRFKQLFFTSVLNAYYAGFIPCVFAVSIYYNVLWVTQQFIFTWLSCLTMTAVFIFPSKYCDILHRAALHLGNWQRLEVSPTGNSLLGVSAATWNKTTVWCNGSIVKHCGELYRCAGPATVALPGNTTHSRFYRLFNNPANIYMLLTTLQVGIVLSGLALLWWAVEWHFILSIFFVAFTNYFALFKIFRDFLITKRIYKAEMCIIDNQLNLLHNQ